MSALASGNKLIKVALSRQWTANALSVDSWKWIFFAEDSDFMLPRDLKPEDLKYHNLPVVNWCMMSQVCFFVNMKATVQSRRYMLSRSRKSSHLLNPIRKVEGVDTPPIEEMIAEKEVKTL